MRNVYLKIRITTFKAKSRHFSVTLGPVIMPVCIYRVV